MPHSNRLVRVRPDKKDLSFPARLLLHFNIHVRNVPHNLSMHPGLLLKRWRVSLLFSVFIKNHMTFQAECICCHSSPLNHIINFQALYSAQTETLMCCEMWSFTTTAFLLAGCFFFLFFPLGTVQMRHVYWWCSGLIHLQQNLSIPHHVCLWWLCSGCPPAWDCCHLKYP